MVASKVKAPRTKAATKVAAKTSEWTFLTNHAHVLLCLARDSDALMKDVAANIGITERAVQRIVSDLEASGYVERERDGRRNRYNVRSELPLRHPIEGHRKVESLLSLVSTQPTRTRERAAGQGTRPAQPARRRPSTSARKTARN